MNKKHIVTIIVPIYNAEKTLHSCLTSIVEQTYRHLEIILVNDGSTDNSLYICEQFAQKDKRIKIINQKNKGPSSARNEGVNKATGTYIQFVDADDLIEKTMTEQLMLNADNRIDLVLCGYYVRKGENNEAIVPHIKGLFTMNHFIHYVGNLYANHLLPSPCNKLYRTNIIKHNDITFPLNVNLGEDLLFNIKYLKHCQNIYIKDAPLYIYYDHEKSLTKQIHDEYFNHQLMLINEVKQFLYEHNAYSSLNIKALDDVFSQTIINTFSQLFRQHHNKEKIKFEIRNLSSHPLIRKHLPSFTGSNQATLIKLLIKFNLNNFIYLLFKIKQMMSMRTNRLYRFLKKLNDKSKRVM